PGRRREERSGNARSLISQPAEEKGATVVVEVKQELERFVEGFRNEHCSARDIFLAIGQGLRERDGNRIGDLMNQANAAIGPHMRYEEEEMYPALVALFGPDYIERMLEDHDRAFGVAARLMELASHDPITEEDIEEGNGIIQGLLPHVTDCDG